MACLTKVLWLLCEDYTMAGGKGGSREISYESTAMILMKMRCMDQDGRGRDGGRWSDSGCILQVGPSGLDEG